MQSEELEKRVAELEHQNRQLSRGLSGLLLVGCLLLGGWNLYQAQWIPRFSDIYDQMLNGKALPPLSTFVINFAVGLFFLALALPIAAIAIFFTFGRRPSSVWLMLAILLLMGFQVILTRNALWAPMLQIISEMSSA